MNEELNELLSEQALYAAEWGGDREHSPNNPECVRWGCWCLADPFGFQAAINPESEWILDDDDEEETDKGCGHCTSSCNDDYCVKGR